jgi:hypothetical protein
VELDPAPVAAPPVSASPTVRYRGSQARTIDPLPTFANLDSKRQSCRSPNGVPAVAPAPADPGA